MPTSKSSLGRRWPEWIAPETVVVAQLGAGIVGGTRRHEDLGFHGLARPSEARLLGALSRAVTRTLPLLSGLGARLDCSGFGSACLPRLRARRRAAVAGGRPKSWWHGFGRRQHDDLFRRWRRRRCGRRLD